MRQCGIIAAGALYALEHHRERLTEDHDNAELLAAAIRQTGRLKLCPDEIDSNIVIFEVPAELGTAQQFNTQLHEAGVWALTISAQQIRLVTHLDVSQAQCRQAAEIIARLAG